MHENVKPEWAIEVMTVCEDCKRAGEEPVFYDYMLDAHTVGLERFGAKELQVVMALPQELIGYTLNSVGLRIRDEGLKLKDGDTIDGLFENNVCVKVFETADADGKTIHRLIFPDSEMKFPEESREYPYYMQHEGPYQRM